MKNAELISEIKDIKKEMPFYDELYKHIDIPKIDHILFLLFESLPNTNKWGPLQVLNIDIVNYILDVPILDVRKLILLYNDGDFTMSYIEKKLKYQSKHTPNDLSAFSNEEQMALKGDALKLLYLFEDFVLTHYVRRFQKYNSIIDNIEEPQTSKLRRSHTKELFLAPHNVSPKDLPKLSLTPLDDWQESCEELLQIFTLYFHKLGLIYDVFPPVYSKIYSIDSKELDAKPMNEIKEGFFLERNGG